MPKMAKPTKEEGRSFFSADFCEKFCPICTRARNGVTWARWLQKLELWLTCGGCPFGRARWKKYGVRPDEPRPSSQNT